MDSISAMNATSPSLDLNRMPQRQLFPSGPWSNAELMLTSKYCKELSRQNRSFPSWYDRGEHGKLSSFTFLWKWIRCWDLLHIAILNVVAHKVPFFSDLDSFIDNLENFFLRWASLRVHYLIAGQRHQRSWADQGTVPGHKNKKGTWSKCREFLDDISHFGKPNKGLPNWEWWDGHKAPSCWRNPGFMIILSSKEEENWFATLEWRYLGSKMLEVLVLMDNL